MTINTRQWALAWAFQLASFAGKIILLARPNGITLGRKRKALLIGINYDAAQEEDIVRLRFPQRDLKLMRALLKDKFGYRDEDIITLTDNTAEVEAGISRQPTRENIMREVRHFIDRREDNMDYVLFYSGHSDQHLEPESDNPPVEEDGLKEYITPVDTVKGPTREDLPESVIYDTYLHEQIIVPLSETRGCHLFALFDSCHSATLLNLNHHRCNRIGTPTSAFRRLIRHFFIEDVFNPMRKRLFGTTAGGDRPNSTPNPTKFTKCTGFCPRTPNQSRKSTVICISACKDRETAFEHESSDTLTSAIVTLLREKPKASLKDVMYTATGVVVKVLEAAKEHLEREQISPWRRRLPFRTFFTSSPATSPPAEELIDISKLAKWHPQLSSNDPLDTNTTSLYSDGPQDLDAQGRVRVRRRKGIQLKFKPDNPLPIPSPYDRDGRCR